MTIITIGNEEFPSIAAARRRASEVLRRWGGESSFIAGEDLDFVVALFARHPEARTKAGTGVVGFYVDQRPRCRTANFYVVRADGSSDDFSIKRCLGIATNK